MGMLVNGTWQAQPLFQNDPKGKFVRPASAFREHISQSDGAKFKAEPNRYHLYVSYACPWASRTILMRAIKELTTIISLNAVKPLMLKNGWEFSQENTETQDTLYHSHYLYELYLKADPHYSGKVTTPVLWDKKYQTIVNNESSDIMRMLNSQFNEFTPNKTDYYPLALQGKINKLNDFIYDTINNGVYQCGFAKSQQAYDKAFTKLFSALDHLESLLTNQQYLLGDIITEADWRLFVTLIRFDVVYFSHFKCNLKPIDQYPNLALYLRRLYQKPAVKSTVKFNVIKEHYYGSHRLLNPFGIIPIGPEINFD